MGETYKSFVIFGPDVEAYLAKEKHLAWSSLKTAKLKKKCKTCYNEFSEKVYENQLISHSHSDNLREVYKKKH